MIIWQSSSEKTGGYDSHLVAFGSHQHLPISLRLMPHAGCRVYDHLGAASRNTCQIYDHLVPYSFPLLKETNTSKFIAAPVLAAHLTLISQ